MSLFAAIVIKSIIVSIIVMGITLLVRRQSAAMQSTVTHLGLGVLLATPILAGLFHFVGIGFSLAAAPETTQALDITPAYAGMSQWSSDASPEVALPAAPEAILVPSLPTALITSTTFLWLVPAAVLLFRLMLAHHKVRRLLSQAAKVEEKEILTTLRELVGRSGSRHPVNLLVSSAVDSPVSVGFKQAAIVLDPQTLQEREGLECILAHELAHIAARDSLRLCVSRIATAVFWFNPLVWILEKRASFIREAAADEMVVRYLHRPIEYAMLLSAHAKGRVLNPLRAAHAIAPAKSEFKARIHRILHQPAIDRDNRSLSWSALLLGLTAPLLVAAYGQVERKIEISPSHHSAKSSLVSQTLVGKTASGAHTDAGAVTSGPELRVAEQIVKNTLQRASASVSKVVNSSSVVSVERDRNPAFPSQHSVSELLSQNLEATKGARNVSRVRLRASEGDKRFAEKAQRIFPPLGSSSAIEMSILSRAAPINDLAAMRTYGLEDLDFNEILAAASLGVKSDFLRSATRNGCTQHTLDELMAIAALGAIPGEVTAGKHKCEVPTIRQNNAHLSSFND